MEADVFEGNSTGSVALSFIPISPVKKTAAPQAVLEERVAISLARFPPRAKLGFGSVTVGTTKTFPVEIWIPAARDEVGPISVVFAQTISKGHTQPRLLTSLGGEELQGGELILADGSDRVELYVCYAPEKQDTEGFIGSISIQSSISGMLLKAELSVSGKAAVPVGPAPGKPLKGKPAGARPLVASSRAAPCPAASAGPVKPVIPTAAKPAPQSSRPASSGQGRPAQSATRTGLAHRSDTAKEPCTPAASRPGVPSAQGAEKVMTAVGSPEHWNDAERVRDQAPTELAACSPASPVLDAEPSSASPSSTASEPDARPRGQMDTMGVLNKSGSAPGGSVSARPGSVHTSRSNAAPKGSKPPAPYLPKPKLALGGGQPMSSRPSGVHTSSPVGSTRPASRRVTASAPPPPSPTAAMPPGPITTAATAGSSGGSPAPTLSQRSLSGGVYAAGARARTSLAPMSAAKTAAVHAKASKSYLQVHTELPLAKQERALVAWLNSHLSAFRAEFQQAGSGGAPTALTLQRLGAQVQGLLWRQYKKDQGLYETMRRVHGKIDTGIFNLTDSPLVADVREAQALLEPLMSYHPFWLRAALATVLRESMGPHAPSAPGRPEGSRADEALRRGLQAAVRELFLYEREMAAAGDKQDFWVSSRDFILKNFLLLVLLLDKTVSDPGVKLPKGTPPLFGLQAQYKSSKQVLRAFLTNRMRGMGDAVHHLELWGYKVEHVQQPADEFDYAVTNLKEDLRSGVRLAKLYELLTGFPSLLHNTIGKWQLWLNPTCDQHRLDNLDKVLDKFAALGALPPQGQRILTHAGPALLRARDICDANRDITLGLLWTIAMKWQVPRLVDMHALRLETRRLLRLVQAKLRRPPPEPLDVYPEQPRISQLLKWAQAACMLHGLRLHNFGSSFGDGRALCYLVSVYLPEWLPASSIYQPDAPKPEDVAVLIEGDEEVDVETLRQKGWCAVYEAGGYIDDKGLLKSFKEGVRHNYEQVHSVAARLGRVPQMLSPEDALDGGLEEKAVILFVAHLANRLLELSREDRAAHIITQALRKYVWEKKYGPVLRDKAASTLQKYWRRQLAMRRLASLKVEAAAAAAQREEERRRAATVVLQAAWRSYCAQKEFALRRLLHHVSVKHAALVASRLAARQDQAAVVIQAAWRARAARVQLREAVAAAVCLQSYWRMARARQAFLQLRSAAVLLQRLTRSMLARGSAARTQRAAVAVQAAWRGWSHRRRFCQQKAAAVRIQATWRSYFQRVRFIQMRRAAVSIQAAWRGHTARARTQQWSMAAARVQAAYKGWVQRCTFLRTKAAVTFLQAAWRGHLVRRNVAHMSQAARLLQAAWRGYSTRKCISAQHAAATRIQAAWRGHIQAARFAMRRAAVVKLQALWRGHSTRMALQVQARAATLVQAAWRGHSVRKQVQQWQLAAAHMQAAWKGYRVRKLVQQQHKAAVCVQAVWRGHKVRASAQQWQRAARLIQAAWRGHRARVQLRQQRLAVTRLQAAWRGYVVRRSVQQQHRAAALIQALWQGHKVRTSLRHQHRAATLIQAGWRAHAVRVQMAHQRRAVTIIQARWRCVVQARKFQHLRAAVVSVQAAWRGTAARSAVRRAHQAAALIQRVWRGKQAEKKYRHARRAVTAVQAAVRGWLARRQCQALRHAAIVWQSAARARAARLQLLQHKAARSIQAAWRCHRAQKQLHSARAAAASIQAAWRMHACRASYLQLRAAAVQVQSAVRCWLAGRALARGRSAATHIQAVWRGHAVRAAVQREKSAAMLIQAAWRGHKARFEYAAALSRIIRLQACVRGWLARNHAEELRGAVVVIQAAWRGWYARQHTAQLRHEHEAATVLQAAARRWLAHRAAQHRAAGVLVLQSYARRWLAQRRAAEMRAIEGFERAAKVYMVRYQAACRLQEWWRAVRTGQLVRREYGPQLAARRQHRKEEAAAVKIQQAFRSYRARTTYVRQRAALAVISAAVPMFRARLELVRLKRSKGAEERSALLIQSYFRGWLARKGHALRLRRLILVQALWRGYHVRLTDGRAKAEARRKLAAAAAVAARNPHKTLGARVRDALEQLLSRRDPVQLSQAIAAMVTGTQWSLACCEVIALEGGVAALLRLMRALNRSKPHVDLLLGVLQVLANICRHPGLIQAVFSSEDCIMVLSERLQFFRDLEDVFMAAAGVLKQLLAPPGNALQVARMPGVLKQWEGVAQIISRRMDMERKYLHRLEGQKGSDVSAKEATRKLLAATKQLDSLSGLITQVTTEAEAHGIEVVHHNMVPHALNSSSAVMPAPDTSSVPEAVVPAAASATQTWQPKNTLVRGVLKEATQHAALQQAAAAAAAAAAAQADAAGGTGALRVAAQVAEAVEAVAGTPGGMGTQHPGSTGPHVSQFTVGAGLESSQAPGISALSGRLGPGSEAVSSAVQTSSRPPHAPLPSHGAAKSARAPPMLQKLSSAATPRTARKPRQTAD